MDERVTPPPPPVNQVPPPPPPPARPVSQVTPVAPPPTGNRFKNTPGVVKASGSPLKKILFFLVIVLLLAAIGLGAYRILGSRKDGGPVTLTYWGLWEPESVMRPLLDEFQSSHPNITVDYRLEKVTEYRERLTSALSQGKGPDVFRLHASWVPMFVNELSPVPASVYSAQDFDTTFYPPAREILRYGSNYYAVPLMYDGLIMYVNDDILSQTGLAVPKTWDELRIAALSMSRCFTDTGTCSPGARVDVAGTSLGLTQNVDHWQDVLSVLLLQNAVNLFSPTGPAANDVLAFYSNFSKAYGIWSAEMPSSTQSFASGKVGVYFGPSWRVFDIKAINPNLHFSTHSIPQLPVDPARGEQPIEWATFWAEGVNSKSPNAAAAWELIKFLSSRETQQKFFTAAKNSGRDFGEPYSRTDLRDELTDDPFLAPLMAQPQLARTWYMASSTFDGANGINTLLSSAFAKALDTNDSTELPKEINGILGKYGLVAPSQ